MSFFDSRHARGRATAVAVVFLTVVAASACSGGSTTTASPTSTTTPASLAAPSVTSPSTDLARTARTPLTALASATAAAATGRGQVVAITVSGGKVIGPKGRVKVKRGSTVTLQVTSDVADEIHLHGYDKSADVEQGGTASLTFEATITGVFEVELEKRGLRLTQLQVR